MNENLPKTVSLAEPLKNDRKVNNGHGAIISVSEYLITVLEYNVNFRRADGSTALHVATKHGHQGIAQSYQDAHKIT